MAKYNTDLQSNNMDLQSILEQVKTLPDPKQEESGNVTITNNGIQTFSPTQGNVFKDFTVKTEVQSAGATIRPLTVTKNGKYNAATDGIDGYSPITVDCPVPKEEQAYNKTYTSNGNYPITPDNGKVISGGSIIVNTPTPKPEETKTVKYTSNGRRDIFPTNGKVMTKVSVEVSVPSDKKPEVAGNKVITQNGKQTFSPPAGNVFSNFTADVQVPQLDTSDATAIEEDVFKDKTYYSKGIKKTGTFDLSPELTEQDDLINQMAEALKNATIPNNKPNVSPLNITQNGTYDASSQGLDGYTPVTVNCPKPKPEVLGNQTITSNGTQTFNPPEGSVFKNFTVKTSITPPPVYINPLTITKNGKYDAVPNGIDGYNPITVNCPEPKPEQQKTLNITQNGNYSINPDVGKVLSKAFVNVNVAGTKPDISPFSEIRVRTVVPASTTTISILASDSLSTLTDIVVFSDNGTGTSFEAFPIVATIRISGNSFSQRYLDVFYKNPKGKYIHDSKADIFGDTSSGIKIRLADSTFNTSGTYYVVLIYK